MRHLLESELEFLRNTYYNRLTAVLVVPCPCNGKTSEGKTLLINSHYSSMTHAAILVLVDVHYVLLDECLSKRVMRNA